MSEWIKIKINIHSENKAMAWNGILYFRYTLYADMFHKFKINKLLIMWQSWGLLLPGERHDDFIKSLPKYPQCADRKQGSVATQIWFQSGSIIFCSMAWGWFSSPLRSPSSFNGGTQGNRFPARTKWYTVQKARSPDVDIVSVQWICSLSI